MFLYSGDIPEYDYLWVLSIVSGILVILGLYLWCYQPEYFRYVVVLELIKGVTMIFMIKIPPLN